LSQATYSDIEQKYSIKITTPPPGFFLNRRKRDVARNSQGALKETKPAKIIRRWMNKIFGSLLKPLYPEKRETEFFFPLAIHLLRLKKTYNATISIGLPFSVHLGTAIALRANRRLSKTAIADYGDPFSKNGKRGKLWHVLEKSALKTFHFVTVPVPNAREKFIGLKDLSRVKVIPQGFDFEETKLAKRQISPGVPTFGFAGNFYKKIRNPSGLLKYLSERKGNFRFIIYTDFGDTETMEIIDPYRSLLGDRLIVNSLLPRLTVIYELSKMDFLINLGNASTFQQPSKLIDYALTKRPILSFTQDTFNPAELELFLSGDYQHRTQIDLSLYDIRIVANDYITLIEKGQEL
jgi:hypothetical protein